MRELALRPDIAPMSETAIAKVRALESAALELPQVEVRIDQTLHAGVYLRVAYLPPGTLITGALIKVETIVAVQGEALMYSEDGVVRLSGHAILRAAAGRKSAFYAVGSTTISMMFATTARTVDEAEEQFTDEHALLTTRTTGESQ
jgi:hypothetical protein